MKHAAFLCAMLIVSVTAERPARADSLAAQDLAARAGRRILQGDRRGAVAFLEMAYESDPLPAYLVQIVEQYESLALEGNDPHDLELARAKLRLVIALETDPARKQDFQARLQRLEARAAALPSTPGEPPASGARAVPDSSSPPAQPPPAQPQPAQPQPAQPQPAVTPAPVPPGSPPTPTSRPQEVSVQFVAGDQSESFRVEVGHESCTTPCSLQLAPGPYTMKTTGTASRKITLYVRESSGVVRIPATGSKFVLPGVILVVAGTVVASAFWAFELACPAQLDLLPTACQTANEVIWPLLGSAAVVTGVAFLGYYGAHYVTSVDMEASNEPQTRPAFRLASFGLQPLRSGAAVGAAFSF